MIIEINAKVSKNVFDLKDLKKDLKKIFKSQKKFKEKNKKDNIEISNIRPKNDIICYFKKEDGIRIIDDDSITSENSNEKKQILENNKDTDYKYKLSIDFILYDKGEEYEKTITKNEKLVEQFFKYVSEKYKCEVLVHSSNSYAYILKNGKIIRDILGTKEESNKENSLEMKIDDKSSTMFFPIWGIVVYLGFAIYLLSSYFNAIDNKNLTTLFSAIFFIILTILCIIWLIKLINKGKSYLDIDSSGIFYSSKNYDRFYDWKETKSIILRKKVLKPSDDNQKIEEIDLEADNSKFLSNLGTEDYQEYTYWTKVSEFSKKEGLYIITDSKEGYLVRFNCYQLPEKIKKIWQESLNKNVKNK